MYLLQPVGEEEIQSEDCEMKEEKAKLKRREIYICKNRNETIDLCYLRRSVIYNSSPYFNGWVVRSYSNQASLC